MSKKFEMTGSPKPFFKQKSVFVEKMNELGWEQCKMTKKNNQCDVLVCDSPESGTSKLILASTLGVEIMTYEDIVELFDLD